jgi:transposase
MEARQSAGCIFMQDNAPVHTSRSSIAFLEENKVQTLGLPANSPDLNPIENIWGLMKKKHSEFEIKTLQHSIWKKSGRSEHHVQHLSRRLHITLSKFQQRLKL